MKLRFIVGDTNKYCSHIWKVVTCKEDVYIMCGSGRQHKISLHGSGVCHSAVTQEHMADFNIEPGKRTNVRWKLSLEENESAIALTVIIPFDQLADRSASISPNKQISRIPTPPIGTAAVIYFIKTKSGQSEINWILDPGVKCLHTLRLQSGDTLSILYRYTQQFNEMVGQQKKLLSCMANIAKTKTSRQITGGFVVVEDAQGRMYWIELKL